jgi:hypothetical protein
MQKHRSEHRWRDFSFSEPQTNTSSLMNQPAIRSLGLTPKPGFAALADSWRAPAAEGSAQPRRIEGVVSTTESQGITRDAGGWAGVLAR